MTFKGIWGPKISEDTKKLALAKLKSSGLTEKDAGILRLYIVEDAGKDFDPSLKNLPAIIFTYFYKDGTPVDREIFWRSRYLKTPPVGTGWEAQIAPDSKKNRYRQAKGTPPWVYLPPNIIIGESEKTWEEIFGEKEKERLYATEGELKAACACKRGLPTFAFGGVRSFSSISSRGVDGVSPLLSGEELRGFFLAVVFDTDVAEGYKEPVRRAASDFMDWSVERGATPSMVTLPYESNGKMGLDDYLVGHTNEEFGEIVERCTLRHKDAQKILKYSQEWGYIESLDRFVYLGLNPKSGNRLLVSQDQFERITGYDEVRMRRLRNLHSKEDGFEVRSVPSVVPLAKALLSSPAFPRFDGIAYRPGESGIVKTRNGQLINLWMGWRCEYEGERAIYLLPEKSRREYWVNLWREGLDVVFGEDPVARKWIESWLLFPMRHPSERVDSYVLVWGEQGCGKTFFGEMQAYYIYGVEAGFPQHGWVLTPDELDSDFNEYAYRNSFLLMDEVKTSSNRRDVDAKLKALITSAHMSINVKHQRPVRMDNRLLFWGSSNSELPVFTTADARRPFIWRAPNRGREWGRWDELSAGFKSGEAGASLLHYARESEAVRALLEKFNPKAPPPITDAKIEMSLVWMPPEEEWLRDLVQDCREGRFTRTVVTSSELALLYNRTHLMNDEKSVTSYTMGKLLSRVGAKYVGRTPMRLKNGEQLRPWALVPDSVNLKSLTDKDGNPTPFARIGAPETEKKY